jgi:hypothetical protein
VSPKVIRIGVPSEAPASCAPEVEVGLGDGAEVLASEVLVPCSPASSAPHAGSDMTASRARTSAWRRCARRDRRGLDGLIVVTVWCVVVQRAV